MILRAGLIFLVFLSTSIRLEAFGPDQSFQTAILKLSGNNGGARRSAIRDLFSMVKNRTNVIARLDEGSVELGDRALYEYPLLILSGSQPIGPLTKSERSKLRHYLMIGGTLVANNDNGVADSGFTRSLKRELALMFNDSQFRSPAREHSIFQSFYLLGRAAGRIRNERPMEVLDLGGRSAVFIFQSDLFGAFQKDDVGRWSFDVEDPLGRRFCFRTAVNLIYYVLTKDYKQDQIHIKFIVERRRLW